MIDIDDVIGVVNPEDGIGGVPMNVVALLDGLYDEKAVEQNDGGEPPPKSSHFGVIPLLPLSYKMNFDSAMDTMTNRRFRRGF